MHEIEDTLFKSHSIMKNISCLLLAALLCGCAGQPEAIVEGTVTGFPDGTLAYLFDSEQRTIDSVKVTGGAYRFEVKKAYPDMALLAFEGENRTFPFFLEPGAITVTADFTAEPVVRFTGTESNEQLTAMNESRASYAARFQELESRLIQLETAGQAETPRFDSLLTVYRQLTAKYDDDQRQFFLANPNTVFAAYGQYAGAHALHTPAEVDSVLNLIAGAPANVFTDRLKERRDMLAATAFGQSAPDFTQAQPDGTPLSLSSLRGKLVLIDFWASWCGPCRAENPNVVRIYDRFKDRGIEILGVSLDENRAAWLGAIEEDGLTWKHVSDLKGWSNAVAQQYAVRSIPHTVLVGPDGVILAKNLRGEALEQKIAEVLGTE
jgi:peroxiredoxin